MRVLISGGSGLIGSLLREHLSSTGHEVTLLARGRRAAGEPWWDPAAGVLDAEVLAGFDAVVHLSGASIGEGRWTAGRKRELWSSRIDSTRLLVDRLIEASARPRVLVCASAVGFYGDRGDEVLDEGSSRGQGFLASLVEAWEAEAARATEGGVRVVSTRFGIVMSPRDGALRRLARVFRFGVGGRLGSGRQWMSWVAPADLARAIEWVLEHDLAGPVNVASPEPVTNADLTGALGRVLGRPALVPVPPVALRLALGQSADELLLASQRVLPHRLTESGFVFTLPSIEAALRVALHPAGARRTAA